MFQTKIKVIMLNKANVKGELLISIKVFSKLLIHKMHHLHRMLMYKY